MGVIRDTTDMPIYKTLYSIYILQTVVRRGFIARHHRIIIIKYNCRYCYNTVCIENKIKMKFEIIYPGKRTERNPQFCCVYSRRYYI